jgi:hypothetical protein
MNNSTEICVAASKANQLETVTYVTSNGGVGLGKLTGEHTHDENGVRTGTTTIILRNGGNGFYYPVEEVIAHFRDNGRGYMKAVQGLALPPAYKA